MLKTSYHIDGKHWVPIARAAALVGTNPAGIKKRMGDGTLEWCQLRNGSTTLLVSEEDVLRVRFERKQFRKEGAGKPEPKRRADLPAQPARNRYSVLKPTWDPTPVTHPDLYPKGE